MNSDRSFFNHLDNSSMSDSSKQSTSFLIKTLLLGLFCLLLLIPLAMVNGLVSSRKYEGRKVKSEITSRWGQSQNLFTPVLVIPYTPTSKSSSKKVEEKLLYLLPKEVSAAADLAIERRHRSIYEVAVYNAITDVQGTWSAQDIRDAIAEVPGEYDLERAKISLSISDVVGYKDIVYIQVNGKKLKMKSDPSFSLSTIIDDDLEPSVLTWDFSCSYDNDRTLNVGVQSARYPLVLDENFGDISFQLNLDIRGSEHFGILTNATTAKTTIKGNWANPSFKGRQLPTAHEIDKEGFAAEFDTFFEDSYVTDDQRPALLNNSHFVSLIDPADHYAQTERSTKYGILVIILTLLSVYLIELTLRRRGQSINIIHYILSGASLVLFYTLLLSFSEIIGFGWAYLIAAVMTVVLNTLYFRAVLQGKKEALLLCAIMSLLYLVIYILLQLASYALLAGSLALFVILAVVMYYTAKVTKD